MFMDESKGEHIETWKEVLFKKLRRRFAEYEAAVLAKDKLSKKNAKQAIFDELGP
jgi:hypothetical protein